MLIALSGVCMCSVLCGTLPGHRQHRRHNPAPSSTQSPGGRAVEKRPREEKASTATVCWTRAEHGTAGHTASGPRRMLGGLSGSFPRQALSPSPVERKCWPGSSLKPLLALISLEHSHLSGSDQLGRQRDGTPLGISQPHFAPLLSLSRTTHPHWLTVLELCVRGNGIPVSNPPCAGTGAGY